MSKIKLLIAIKAPAEKVFPLVATAAGFSQWWAADITETAEEVTLWFFKRSTEYRLRRTRAVAPGDSAASVGRAVGRSRMALPHGAGVAGHAHRL